MKPTPNAAPIIPNTALRFSGGVTSAITALAGPKVAPAMPAMTRPTNSHNRLGAQAISA